MITSRIASALIAALIIATPGFGQSWIEVTSTGPSPRVEGAMAYHAPASRTVLYGGRDPVTSAYLGDTWIFDGGTATWTQLTPATNPPATGRFRMVEDPARGVLVMVGGVFGGTFEHWEWNGVDWTQMFPATVPNAALAWDNHSMAYDLGRGRIVMFGNLNPPANSETWEYDALFTTWVQINPATVPVGRSDTALAYDAASGKVLMFGGGGPAGALGDFWEWDGINWNQLTPAILPPARLQHVMVHDAQRGRTVVLGGLGFGGELGDCWEWDGSLWYEYRNIAIPGGGGGFLPAHYAFDWTRNRAIVHQGTATQPLAQVVGTWELVPDQASYQRYGGGCAGSGGTHQLDISAGLPAAGTAFTITQTNLSANAPVFLFVDTTQAVISLGGSGCTQLIGGNILFALPAIADAGGTASHFLSLPPTIPPGLAFIQGAAVDPGAPFGFTVSSGGRVHFR